MLALLLVVIISYFIYTLVPFFLTRLLGIGVVKKNNDMLVALTFDDGPHPVYTPLLLELLKKKAVKATFFVQGNKAQKYPDIIQQIHNEGHMVALHNFAHHCHWIMMPWTVQKKLEEASSVIEAIISIKPVYFRPPWGLLNIFDLFKTRRTYKIVLWSVMVGDWLYRGGSDRIKNGLIKKVKSGSIICLHDSGETSGANEKAPENMLVALEGFLNETNFQYGFIN